MSDLDARLASIERDLAAGTYVPGPWKAFVAEAARRPDAERAALAERVSGVSAALHRRRHRRVWPLGVGVGLELALALLGTGVVLWGAGRDTALGAAVGALLLATAAQPLVKVACGRALGVRYSYAYLLNGEPRFKMRFGDYLALPAARRAAVHLAGMVGSPLGWWVGAALAAPALPGTARVIAVAGALHLGVQVPILVWAARGRALGSLTHLTSAGNAGREWRRRREG